MVVEVWNQEGSNLEYSCSPKLELENVVKLFDMLYSHFPLSEGADQMSSRLIQSENFKVQLFYVALRGSTSKVSLEEYLDC